MSLEKDLECRVLHYKTLTAKALKKIKSAKGLSKKEREIARDFLEMCQNYFSDACYFIEKKDFLTALAAFSYAHAWLDAGVRAGLFHATDSRLFTLKK
jgi:hypothetical protein